MSTDCCYPGCSCVTSVLAKFHRGLNKLFYGLGSNVAKYKGYFIIIPLFLTVLSITGFQKIYYEDDPEYLFAPSTGPARGERAIIEDSFSMNFSSLFDPTRITRTGRFARFIVIANDGGTVLRRYIWNDIVKLDKTVRDVSIEYEEKHYGYKDLCAIKEGKCFKNEVLGLGSVIDQVENGSFQIQYPVNLEPFLVPHFFGGLELDEKEEVVISAKAITLFYWIKTDNDEEISRGKVWEKKILKIFDSKTFDLITVARFTSTTLEDELENNTNSVKPFVAVTLTIMTVFSVFASIMGDWVRGKPFLGMLGVMTSVFSSFAAFGFLIYINVPFIGINMAAPFLMLGIGIDDTFVMLAAWRRTRLQDSVPQRLAETYSEAAVSITITSLTDMISFFIGVITPFPSVQIFCLYTGTAVFVTYLWHITFFGGCLAVAGYAENNQRHSLLCVKVKPKSETGNHNCLYTTFCAGGISESDPWNPRDNQEHAIMVFFRDYVGAFLNIPAIKTFVICIFALYLGGAVYGCMRVKEGLEKRRLSRYDSYSVDFYDLEDKYFREFPYNVQVVVTGNLTYSDPQIKSDYLDLMKKFEEQNYIHPTYTQSVIRYWYSFLEENEEWLDFNITDEKSFITYLREVYVSDPSDVLNLDIKYNEDYSRILATRFILQTFNLPNSNADKDMMEGLRAIARESKMNVTLFNPYFVFFDQLVLVRELSIQAISLAALVMMFVSFIFIPNTWCSLWVAFSIISIEVGVVGYMTMWNVNLDSISMINLIMCIGFSVDFSAHISYAYLTSKAESAEEKVKDCLFTLGLPIVQGGLSTILGVIALTMAPSYIFVTFFKIVFLVIFFGIMHGIFLLPVLLSLVGPSSITRKKDANIYETNKMYIHKSTLEPSIRSIPEKPLRITQDKKYSATKTKDLKSSEGGVIFQSGTFLAPILMQADKYNDAVVDKDMGIGTSGEDTSESSSQGREESNNESEFSVEEIKKAKNHKNKNPDFQIKEVYSNKAFTADVELEGVHYENRYYDTYTNRKNPKPRNNAQIIDRNSRNENSKERNSKDSNSADWNTKDRKTNPKDPKCKHHHSSKHCDDADDYQKIRRHHRNNK